MICLKYVKLLPQPYGMLSLLPDGSTSSNWPPNDEAFADKARYCGFVDCCAYVRHHELAHAFIAEKFFDAPSPIIWAAAHHLPIDPIASMYEERWVYHWQRFANGLIQPLELDWCDGLSEFNELWERVEQCVSRL